MSKTGIDFDLDGATISAHADETILQAAKRHGVDIPHLCYKDGMRADGNCRACMVEIDGERVLAPSCCRQPQEGMKVKSTSDRARHSQRLVLEMLMADAGSTLLHRDSELLHWAGRLGVGESGRLSHRPPLAADLSHPAIAVNLNACIQCTRCVRACREVQGNDVIGFAHRGHHAAIVFDLEDPMGDSSCVGCGECVQACPTGALAPANGAYLETPDREVDSVCPYCGVGCLLRYQIKDDRIIAVEGRDGPSNHSRLCVKGRYGFDYVHHAQRLKKPLIRKDGVAKGMNSHFDPANPLKMFREASWEEALNAAAEGLINLRQRHGSRALAGFGSAKCTNEEAYLFQKLVRTGFGSNNVDHCTRLCHASSVAALMEGIGSGAVSNQVEDVAESEVILVIGANPTENHPVAATFIKNAVRKGAKLIVLDPRKNGLARYATHYLQFRPDSDVALLNAMLHTIVEEGLTNEAFIAERTDNYEAFKANLTGFAPEDMAAICDVEAGRIREIARLYASSKASMILWGMGISQHVHGTDNARCLIALSLITGQIGRPGCGLHPLRGQNNVQGASDMGLIPMVFPDYRPVGDDDARALLERAWNAALDPEPGLTVVEIMEAVLDGQIRGLYILGENPAMSDPNLNHTRKALEQLEHLVVQDLFLTETAAYADVVLPASAWPEKEGTVTNTDRRVQLGRRALPLPGEARQDLDIIQELGRRLGLPWNYSGAADVYEEARSVMPSIAGISWQRLEREDSVTYPCADSEDPGQPIVFKQDFPIAGGRGRLVPAQLIDADEKPDGDYPYVLITGRRLEHWHTGSMTRRASILDALEPVPQVDIHPNDMAQLGLANGVEIRVESRRGHIKAKAHATTAQRRGEIFIPFCYTEAAANLLTNQALDPFGKIPEFKYCSVRISATGH